MTIIPIRLVRLLASYLAPLRWLVAQGWLREADAEWWLQRLHPLLSLQRVYARVESRRWVADDMLAITLRCNGNAADWKPGQHVQLFREIDGVRLSRTYSLTRAQNNGRIELAIKRQDNGKVSGALLDTLAVGERVELGQAQGDLRWSGDSEAVLLLAAGSGITPLLGLLREALANGFQAPVTLLHYVRQRGQQSFRQELQELMQRYPNFQVRWALSAELPVAGELAGRFTGAHVAEVAAQRLLVCGPHGFVEQARDWWQSQPRTHELQYEAFTAPLPLASGETAAVQLGFAKAHQQVAGNNQQNLLEQAEAQGLRPAHGCRQGICASCSCQLLSGSVRHMHSGLVTSEPGQAIRLCVSVPLGDVTLGI
jgi:ferredoxin-NADP reductase